MSPKNKLKAQAKYLDPQKLSFFRKDDRLQVTVKNDRSWLRITPYKLFPLSQGDAYISLRDQNGEEIGIITTPENLNPTDFELLHAALETRYFIPRILKIHTLSEKFRIVQWDVETDRGSKQFLTKPFYSSLTDTSNGYIVTDLENNRYELINIAQMDTKSRSILAKMI